MSKARMLSSQVILEIKRRKRIVCVEPHVKRHVKEGIRDFTATLSEWTPGKDTVKSQKVWRNSKNQWKTVSTKPQEFEPSREYTGGPRSRQESHQ